MTAPLGVLALARSTFDVPYAHEMAAAAFHALDEAGIATRGPRELLFDAAAVETAIASLASEALAGILLMQVTFTDATMTVVVANRIAAPLSIWALPEPRAGGRLRLNAFCGLNLAAHALGRAGKAFSWLYAAPHAPNLTGSLRTLALGQRQAGGDRRRAARAQEIPATEAATRVASRLAGSAIGVIGQHPDGFDTCRYDATALQNLAGVSVTPVALGDVFSRARAVVEPRVEMHRHRVEHLAGIDAVNQVELDRSLRVYDALDGIATEHNLAAMAVRCWPEMFTEYGCAACGPMGLLNGDRLPAACEADVYGALSSLLLQELADASAWLVDIVDLDSASNTGVLWHCGSAPPDMCDPEFAPEAQIHTNRRMPLLQQFPLKAGRVTLARISQARNAPAMVIAGAEVLRAPMSFTGTSAVVRFDHDINQVLDAMMDEALEHHLAIVYGDQRAALEALAARWNLPVIEL